MGSNVNPLTSLIVKVPKTSTVIEPVGSDDTAEATEKNVESFTEASVRFTVYVAGVGMITEMEHTPELDEMSFASKKTELVVAVPLNLGSE